MNLTQEVGETAGRSRNEGYRLQCDKAEFIHEETDAILRKLKEPPTTSHEPSKRKCSFLYYQYIQILLSTQHLFINVYSTTCFDPNGASSGSARLTHSTTELRAAPEDDPLGSKHVVLYMLINKCCVDGRVGIY
jgi:hypothetical protein